jgi:hypothetical protein
MKSLDFAAIAAAQDLARETVEVPAWGGSITVRELSMSERMALGKMSAETPERIPAWLVATAAIDATGAALFPDKAAAEAMLADKGKALETISLVVMRLSGLGGDEDGAKN